MKANARIDRRLRGLVADLAHRPADDIEAVWHALSDAERKQLRPLLKDAASLGQGEPGGLATVLSDAPLQDDGEGSPNHAPAIERLAGHWPDALLAQLAGSVDDAQRTRLFADHPAWRRHTVAPLAPRARDALLRAADEAIRALPPAVEVDTTSQRPPSSWRRRLLDGLRRRRT
ncbi:hypothetical protein WT97_10900 [Burkholderia sp. MSMB1459WGS]|uniref:hypothetical protein n=1 Tax=unclassified Burkholderia TaxID=2613784 RepID=UPI000757C950|nr:MULTISPECIES: hypothetical protein [unclassified Burkholderia]KVT06119.1 hypothetical protein WT24_02450 [Burkholderia sp. MSMB1078WGS]KWO45625.1 hypothetical protein WT97_10900 [Burkholderia sp. MSMB1459WGS]